MAPWRVSPPLRSVEGKAPQVSARVSFLGQSWAQVLAGVWNGPQPCVPRPPSLGPQLSFWEQVAADALLLDASLGPHADPGYGQGSLLTPPFRPSLLKPPHDALWVPLSLPMTLVHDWSGLAFVTHPGTALTVPEWGHWFSRE